MKPSKSFLRQRKASSSTGLAESKDDTAEHALDDRERIEEEVWGKTPGGEGIAIQPFLDSICSLSLGCSFPRTDDTRRPDNPLPSGIPKKSSWLAEFSFTRSPNYVVLPFVPWDGTNVLSVLFCLLARCLWRWTRLGAHKAEQEEVDRKRGSETRVARWKAQTSCQELGS